VIYTFRLSADKKNLGFWYSSRARSVISHGIRVKMYVYSDDDLKMGFQEEV
jgi:hypothetical protein